MQDYIAFIANCIIFCDEFTRHGNKKNRNLIRVNIAFEVKLLIMFILLENLKYTFASQVGYLFFKGFYRDVTGGKIRFEQLLKKMFTAAGMNPTLDPIINLRNEIIHSGMSLLPFQQKYNIYVSCHNIFREYFLRLVGYNGEYLLADDDIPKNM
jgi:hypothetical protein